ncbi:MAG: carboxypeptidase-like regulatory domain-containing protein [Taibaiella sp.]|nr:carboxypeptidase-like regulatory domain-containing protein [Taibaiella sp.]
MWHKRSYLFSVLLLLLSFAATAQNNAGIKGFVYDRKTGEPVIYTNVYLRGTKTGAQTDVNGFYSITQVPPGTYQLMVSILGYDTTIVTVVVKAGQELTQKLYVTEKDIALGEVEVNAQKTEKVTHINVGVTSIAQKDIKLLPSAGGEPDVSQYLQVVPGVVFTGDQGGQLYIRGGSPAQTGILLDGVTIYNPFHSIGFYSVFETETIRNVDVQTAGFNAEHGNRVSAILDVHTIDGNKNRTTGILSVSPIMTRAVLQGPLLKSKKNETTNLTYVLSAKTSYLDQTSKSIYGGLGEPFKSGLPYSFTDLYGKITLSGDNGSKVNLFGFSFNDDARLVDPSTHVQTADYKWKAQGGGATFVVSPTGSATLIDGKFAYSNYSIDASQQGLNPASSGISGFETGINFTNFLKGYSEVKYGLEVSGFSTNINYYSGAISNVLNRQNTLAAVYLVYRKDISDKLILEPSIRFQYYSELSSISPEPRIGIKYNITENIRLKAAAGTYTQDIITTKSDRDIVNLFSGFLLSPDETIKNTNGDNVATNLQRAYHVLGGVEVDINKVELNLEPWFKNFTQDITLSHIKTTAAQSDFTASTAKAYGVDLSGKYSSGRVYLWGVVSVQNVMFTTVVPDPANPGKTLVATFPAPFDRRLNVNLLGAYNAGKHKDLELSIRFNLGSPFPFTQTQAFAEGGISPSSNISTNINQNNGTLNILYPNDINGGRLSWYHRLDISAKKSFKLTKNTSIDATASVTNVYDRRNIFYVDRVTNVKVYQLPVFPSLNLTLRF